MYSISCVMLFGETLELTKGNSLYNIGYYEEGNAAGLVLQIFFFVVLGAHIPFMFFVGKESFLILIDELDRRSISLTLQKRMEYYKELYEMNSPKQERETRRYKVSETVDALGQRHTSKVIEFPPNRITELVVAPRPSNNDVREKSKVTRTKSLALAPLRETQSLRCSTNFGVPVLTIDEQTGEQKVENKLAYKDMKPQYYILGTSIYFLLCVVGGMFIPNVEIVINWSSSIQIVIIGFFSPAIFYQLARKRFPQNIDKKMDLFLCCNVVG